MKIRIVRQIAFTIIAAAFFTETYAMGNGFYMGLGVGPANNGGGVELVQDNQTIFINKVVPVHPRSTQVATSIFFGNQFSPYAAFELGFDFFSKIKYDTNNVPTCGEDSRRVRAVDAVMKGILPVWYLSVFAKVGVAMTYVTASGGFNPEVIFPTPTMPPFINCAGEHTNKFSGVFGIGASYDLNQSWLIDVTYTTIQVSGPIGNVSSLMIGLSYHFTDKYCGQFLCDD